MILDTSLEYLHAIELPTPFPVGPITVYLGDAPGEPLTLMDTGPCTSEARAAFDAGLARLGYSPVDLDRIIISHAHVDHFGLAADLVAASNAQLLAHPRSIPALRDFDTERERRTAFYAELLRQAAVPAEVVTTVVQATRGMKRFSRPVAVDAALDEGDRLGLAGFEWRVLHTPGHAAGLICLHEPDSRMLLSSDHLLADISSNPVVEPPAPGQTERPRSLALYKASLQCVAAMNIQQALPSHGPAIHDVPGLVSQRLVFHQRRQVRVLDTLRNGARTTWDVTRTLFPNCSPLDTFLAISEVVGHLDLLEMEGEIAAENADGVSVWRKCRSVLLA